MHGIDSLVRRLIFASAALVLPGCSKADISTSSLVGLWTLAPQSKGLVVTDAHHDRCDLTLGADGSFSSPGVPDYLLDTSDRAKGLLKSGQGRWSKVEHGGYWIVQLDFDRLEGNPVHFQSLSLNIDARPSGAVLFCWVDGEGSKRLDLLHHR